MIVIGIVLIVIAIVIAFTNIALTMRNMDFGVSTFVIHGVAGIFSFVGMVVLVIGIIDYVLVRT